MNVMDMLNLKGRVAVVTGGAGLYGRQIVEALAEAGAKVFMASRDLARLEAQAERFRAAGLDVTALALDQGEPQSIRALLEQVIAAAGTVDVLVNNAVGRSGTGWENPELATGFSRSMQVNATGVVLMTQAFGQFMADRGRGSIINVGSIQGMVGPDLSLYEEMKMGVSPDYFFHKGGMIQLTRFAAAVLGPKNVRVNCISPGGFFNDQDPRFVQRYNARTFLGRMANETDLKGIIVLLASDASAYITGANIPVDGGYTAK